MQITTTKRFTPGTIAAGMPKEFAWSYSKIKNFESCPRKHFHIEVAKDTKEEESDNLLWGNRIHEAAAQRLGPRKVPLPAGMEFLADWIDRVEIGAQGGKLLVEQKYAMTRKMEPCSYFAPTTWVRGVADALILKPPVALSLDWKSGKIIEDSVQLALVGALLFAHYPEIEKIRSTFVWLKEGAQTDVYMTRDDLVSLWAGLMPRVQALEQAAANQNYPPKPSGLCKRYCPVETCEYHGIGSN
jgi:hypothetical protein